MIRSAIFAVALLAGLSAVEARDYNGRSASQYDLNNPDDVKSFWENQRHSGGN